MAKTASKKAFRHGSVTVILTVLVVASILLLNLSVTTLAMRYGWFINMNPTLLYPVTDPCYEYLDTYVLRDDKIKENEQLRIIFCDEKEEIEADGTMAFVHNTALELAEHYDRVSVQYLNIWENPSIARGYGVKASTSVVVALGTEDADGEFKAVDSRVCTLRDFFLFPANDTENPVAYIGEKRFAVAMKAVVTPDAPIAYFTLNHGESVSDYSLMYAVTDAGYTISYLDSLSFDIPEDCGLLVSYNPTRDFTVNDGVSGTSELDKLDAYLNKGGKFMFFASADTFAAGGFPHIEGYLEKWGATFAHETGDSGVEECFSVRDMSHGLTVDGYTLVGQLPTDGKGGEIMKDLGGTVRVANATVIRAAEAFTPANGSFVSGSRTLTPLLRSHEGAEAWAGGRAVDRTKEGYNLVTLTEDASTGGFVLVSSSTELASEDALQSGAYANSAFLLTAMEAMGKTEIPISLRAQPFSDNTIHVMTTATARNVTILLAALPVVLATATGLIVLIRRKFA